MSIDILEFPLCIKNKILRIKDITKLNIEYIVGKNIVFNHSNLSLKELHKIIISNDIDKLVFLCHDDGTNLYDEELSRTITITKLTKIINTLLEENNCSLESMREDINTSTANGKFFIRMFTIFAQLEIERTRKRTKVGMV